MRRKIAVLGLLFMLPAASAYGFACITFQGKCVRWAAGEVTVRSFLGTPANPPLFNGTASWDDNAVDAANDWNVVGAAFHFTVDTGGQFFDPCGPAGPNHACPNTGPAGDNPVFFTDSVCGQSFGPDIIELTQTCYTGSGAILNAPVFVNNGVQWNAYDGPLVAPVNDIRRVLLHEFGHVLGLSHPDKAGQQVVAIMNSRESDIDRLQPDDISGILSLYPSGGGSTGNASSAPNTGCQMADAPAGTHGWLFLLPGVLGMLRASIRRQKRRLLGSNGS